jgi:hypothetical protein
MIFYENYYSFRTQNYKNSIIKFLFNKKITLAESLFLQEKSQDLKLFRIFLDKVGLMEKPL